MAKVDSFLKFTGSIDQLSFYRLKGSDKIIVRYRGGPSRKEVLNSKKFEVARQYMSDFGARSKTAAAISASLSPFSHYAGRSIISPLNSLLQDMQDRDMNDIGTRGLALSQYGSILEGFEFSKQMRIDTVFRGNPIKVRNKETTISINTPSFRISKNQFEYYSLSIIIATVSDLKRQGNMFVSVRAKPWEQLQVENGPWIPTGKQYPALRLSKELLQKRHLSDGIVLVGIGLSFGKQNRKEIKNVHGEGAARIQSVFMGAD